MKRILFLVLAMSLTGFNTYADQHQKGKGGHLKQMMKELNLSDEQFKKLKEFREKNKETKNSFREQMKKARAEFKQKFLKQASDSELKALHTKIQGLRTQVQQKHFERMLFLKNLLNEKQRKKFMESQEGRGKRGKRGMGRKHK